MTPRTDRMTRMLVPLASWGLPGAELLTSPADEAEALDLVAGAAGQRLTGPLVLAVATGAIELPDAAAETLAGRHREAMWWCLAVERRLLEVRELFAAAGGIDHLVVKGSAIAHLDEGDPALRSFADLDLLVRGPHLDRAVAVLRAAGATRPFAERRKGYDHRFAKSVTLTGSDRIELDLHRSLCDGAHGFRIPLDRLFDQASSFTVGGEVVPTLSAPHRLIHAAYHAVLGSPTPKLMSVRDLGGYLTRDDLPLEAVVDEVRRWRGEAVLAAAVRETLATLRLDAPAWQRWLHDVHIDEREQAIVDRQRREGSSLGRAKLDGLVELSPTEGATYLFALAVPSADHLRSRGLTRVGTYRRALGRARRSVAPTREVILGSGPEPRDAEEPT